MRLDCSGSCDTHRIAPAYSASTPSTRAAEAASHAAVGSSSRRTSGCAATCTASSARCASPPDREDHARSRHDAASKPRRDARSSRRASPSSPPPPLDTEDEEDDGAETLRRARCSCRCRCAARLDAAAKSSRGVPVMLGRFCDKYDTRTRQCEAPHSNRSLPPNVQLPRSFLSVGSRPAMPRSNSDFPAPLSPSTNTICVGATVRLTVARNGWAPPPFFS
mmetsp:Transcript_19183/g.47551  ORF Transcript_19183/g.47551 Transcript_19183/m.47551 type:complete len:221 (-) Transcript_19183:169-831(-)